MFVHVQENRSGEVLLHRRLSPYEMKLEGCSERDETWFANYVADRDGFELDFLPDDQFPDLADLTVTFRLRKHDDVVVWSSLGFYYAKE